MTKLRIYIGKNKNKTTDKHPDLKVSIIKTIVGVNGAEDKNEFIDAGALWKSKNGSGYIGEIDTEAVPYRKEEKKEADNSEIPF